MCLVVHFEDCHYQLMVLQLMLLVFATEICGKEKKKIGPASYLIYILAVTEVMTG